MKSIKQSFNKLIIQMIMDEAKRIEREACKRKQPSAYFRARRMQRACELRLARLS